jgi:hypothetical protein
MPRLLLPSAIVASGLVIAAGLTAARYTTLTTGAASDEELYNLIAGALHQAPLASGPAPGQSSLAITPVPGQTDTLRPETPSAVPLGSSGDAAPVYAWATLAAKVDSAALRDWLGPWVLATSLPSRDTVRITLRRFSWHPHCPLISTLVATTAQVHGEARLVGVTATCPEVPAPRAVQ